ncbi:hypothetical protein [Pedobacter frigiditerrae]|uniref:hypothetical protein n=1 Tax=Pedobacter frigiditerrae TaxID=2530452 RepID=UPI00292DD346|nr:hypothetical protein [Pedobacter frigiditerrae]
MIKFPLTPEGVAAMCQHFFKLPAATLEAAAEELATDLPRWVQNTFHLEESQVNYLNDISPNVISFMAANASFALVNKCMIVLEKEAHQDEQLPESKLTKPKSKLAAVILPKGGFTVEGEFVIAITY